MSDDVSDDDLEQAFGDLPEGREPSKKERKARAKAVAKQARKTARIDQREARIREIVREELQRDDDGMLERLREV